MSEVSAKIRKGWGEIGFEIGSDRIRDSEWIIFGCHSLVAQTLPMSQSRWLEKTWKWKPNLSRFDDEWNATISKVLVTVDMACTNTSGSKWSNCEDEIPQRQQKLVRAGKFLLSPLLVWSSYMGWKALSNHQCLQHQQPHVVCLQLFMQLFARGASHRDLLKELGSC